MIVFNEATIIDDLSFGWSSCCSGQLTCFFKYCRDFTGNHKNLPCFSQESLVWLSAQMLSIGIPAFKLFFDNVMQVFFSSLHFLQSACLSGALLDLQLV